MILQSTSEIESLFEGKHQRLKLTDSLHDFFALNPKYYNKQKNDDDKPASTTASIASTTKTVHFADDNSDTLSNLLYHDFSASTRSLTSIADETIDLDHTQHARRTDSMELDTTGHQRKERPKTDLW